MSSATCQLTIDLTIIKQNYLILCQQCPNAVVSAVVKANAYGLGAEPIAKLLEEQGCRHFFVANTQEAFALKKTITPSSFIYVLNGVFADDAQDILNNHFIPVLNNSEQISLWQQTTKNKTASCCLHLNTGMNRLGLPEDELNHLMQDNSLKNLNLSYILSHLSCAEQFENSFNTEQKIKFQRLSKQLPNCKKSLANSSGIFLGKDFHFDLVRPGAALYGLNPTPYLKQSPILNPLTLTAPIIQLQTLKAGESVGYNQTFVAKRTIRLATLPLGYADGYSHRLSNKSIVHIAEHQAPIIGNVSMDLLTIDVTHIPQKYLSLGQPVQVINQSTCLNQLANLGNTIGYEFLTNLGARYERKYIHS